MGIRGLYTYLKHYRTAFDLRSKTDPLRIGIDAMSFLYRYKEQKEEILLVLRKFKELGHKIFFIFDGKPPAEKEAEITARKDARQTAATAASNLEAFLQSESAKEIDEASIQFLEDSLKRSQTRSWNATRTIRRAFQDVLWDEEIPYVKSISEADDVIIDLYFGEKLDVVMSSDMDYLVAGIGRLWIPSQKGIFWFEEILLDDVLVGEEMTRPQLLDMGALSVEYGVHCDTAFTWLRHYGSLQVILKSPSININKHTEQDFRFKPQEVYSRIRPDHLERVKSILDSF